MGITAALPIEFAEAAVEDLKVINAQQVASRARGAIGASWRRRAIKEEELVAAAQPLRTGA